MDLLITNARVWDDRPPVDIASRASASPPSSPGSRPTPGAPSTPAGAPCSPASSSPISTSTRRLIYRRQPARDGTLEEAIRLTGQLKAEQDRDDVLDRSRAVLDMAIAHGTIAVRAHPDVDPIQGLLGVETALTAREEYRDLLDLDVVAFPQEGIIKAPGTTDLMEEALRMGANVVGGCPYNERTWDDTKRHIDTVFELARRFDAPVDMHADFADDASDPRYAAARYIAQKTIEHGFEGRVSLGHVTSLARLTREEAAPVIDLLRDARISIVTLPATDVYLGGRGDERNQRRGVTPVHLLRDSGVNVTFSSNNVRNAFTPFGKADMLQIGNLLAHVAQFGTPHSQSEILRMATYDAARSIGLDDYGLAEGRRADLVVCDSPVVADVLADIPPRLWVVRRGRVTVETRHETTIHRTAPVPGA